MKKYAVCWLLIALIILSVTPLQPQAQNLVDVPSAHVFPNEDAYFFHGQIQDVAMDSTFNYVLTEYAVYIFDNTDTLQAYTDTLTNARAIALFDRLLFVATTTSLHVFDIFGASGKLSAIKTFTATELQAHTFIDMTLSLDNTNTAHIYLAATDGTAYYFSGLEISRLQIVGATQSIIADFVSFNVRIKSAITTTEKNITALTYGSGLFFVSVQGSQQRVCYQHIDSLSATVLFYEDNIGTITDIAYDTTQNALYYTRTKLFMRKAQDSYTTHTEIVFGSLSASISVPQADKLYFSDNKLIISDKTLTSAFIFDTAAQKILKTVTASRGDSLGFFWQPVQAKTRLGNIYIADSLNNRVQILGQNPQEIFGLISPSALAADQKGGVYVADGSLKLRYFDATGAKTQEYASISYRITSMAIDNADTLYFINQTDGHIYYIDDTSTVKALNQSFNAPTLLEVSSTSKSLFVLCSDNSIYTYGDSLQQLNITLTKNVLDFTIDDNDNLYFLYDDNTIQKYAQSEGQYTLQKTITSYSAYKNMLPQSLVSISICDQDIANIKRGDLVLSDATAHCIRTISANVLDTQMHPQLTLQQVLDFDSPAALSTNAQILPLLEDTVLYATLSAAPKIQQLSKNSNLILLSSAPTFFHQVLLADGSGTIGYVRKSACGAPLSAATPAFSKGRILHNNSQVFMYPSASSPVISTLAQNVNVDVQSFATFRDQTNILWLAITTQNGIGYINSANVVYRNYALNANPPKPNARIICPQSQGAQIYEQDGDLFVPLTGEYIPHGAQVKVQGRFDPAQQYTQIQYAHPTYGVLTCYVETQYLSYDGVTAQDIIILILVIASIASAIFTAIFFIKRKKSNML